MSPPIVPIHANGNEAPPAEDQQHHTSAAGHSFVVNVTRPHDGNFTTTRSEPTPGEREAGSEEEVVPQHPLDQAYAAADKEAKKKKKKRSSKKKSTLPTGFEEMYADAPMTPAEHSEEVNDVYHPSRSFAERIESCIQRYRARRRFDNERKDIFDKYLSLGGIDAGPKMFSGGVDQGYLEELEAGDIATVTATDSVGRDKSVMGRDNSTWTVDFEAVVKCFFSSWITGQFDLETPQRIHHCVNVVRNFLNYILYHNVCREYADQVHAARAVCDLAEKELALTNDASVMLPGDFNVACSTLYGGHHRGLYSPNEDWSRGLDVTVGMSDARAAEVMQAALRAYGEDDMAEHLKSQKDVHASTTEEVSIEVIEVVYADEKVTEYYEHANKDRQDKEKFKPLGKLRAKRWFKPFGTQEDCTDDEDEDGPRTNKTSTSENNERAESLYEFWVEDKILDVCFVGMKMDAAIRCLTLDRDGARPSTTNGVSKGERPGVRKITCLDAVYGVYCSFYTNLANELMMGWREPVPIVNGKAQDGEADGRDRQVDDDDGDAGADDDGEGGVRLDGAE